MGGWYMPLLLLPWESLGQVQVASAAAATIWLVGH